MARALDIEALILLDKILSILLEPFLVVFVC